MNLPLLKRYIIKILKPERLISVIRHYKVHKRYKNLHVSVGFNTQITDSTLNEYVWIGDNCKISNCEIGKHTYIGANSNAHNTMIGAFCSISFNVKIGLGIHPSNFVSTHPAFYSNNKPFKTFADKNYVKEYGSIKIGNDVLIGTNSTIMYGVTIGDGAIITNNTVVTKDVPAYAIVGGIPAKIIKFRFDEQTIEKIEQSKWWNWDENKLSINYIRFHNISEFTKP